MQDPLKILLLLSILVPVIIFDVILYNADGTRHDTLFLSIALNQSILITILIILVTNRPCRIIVKNGENKDNNGSIN